MNKPSARASRSASVIWTSLQELARPVTASTSTRPPEIRASLLESRAKVFAAREGRPRPFRDEKILTSWNGLAIGALAFAGGALGRADFVDAADAV